MNEKYPYFKGKRGLVLGTRFMLADFWVVRMERNKRIFRWREFSFGVL